MNKAILKTNWGHYCDTDKLANITMALLSKYNHRNTEHGVCTMLDKYFENKKDLIELFQKSQHYIGDMRIALDVELERENNPVNVRNWCRMFLRDIDARRYIVKKVDEDGKNQGDYLQTGIKHLVPRDFLDDALKAKLSSNGEKLQSFTSTGEYKPSIYMYDDLNRIIYDYFSGNYQAQLCEDVVAQAKEMKMPVKLTTNMKTSRAFNKVCTTYGVDKLPKYNKLFAEYADMVSGLKRKVKFFISLNPLDYLTMSFGVNWSSCQTIDKNNTRNMPNSYSGQYCGGTMSYMLDSTSFITYVHTDMPQSVEEGKVYRNMFHYGDDILVQGRIYPQGNDGATDLYKEFREIVHKELAEMLELDENVWIKSNDSCGGHTSSSGVHYRDYLSFTNCNISYPKGKNIKNQVIDIGHEGICVYCGNDMHNISGMLTCNNCR